MCRQGGRSPEWWRGHWGCWSPCKPRQSSSRRLLHRIEVHCGGGVHVGQEAVLGANVVLTASTPIIDVRGLSPWSTAAPCHRVRSLPAPVQKRSLQAPTGSLRPHHRWQASTDRKTSLNDVLREQPRGVISGMGASARSVHQTAFLGDVVLATAGMEAWHQSFQRTRFTSWSASPWIACLTIHGWARLGVGQTSEDEGKGLAPVDSVGPKARYDVVINLHRHASGGILTALSMAPIRVGFANNPLAWRFTHRVPHQWGDGTHEVDRIGKLLAPFIEAKNFVRATPLPRGRSHPCRGPGPSAHDARIAMGHQGVARRPIRQGA